MANKEQDYKPQAKPADEATKPCQEFIRLYPTRLTLTDKAFEKIRTEGTAPVMPKGIPTAGDDYELRRLRSGYIYILAENAESDCFSITGEAENGQAWYIYEYSHTDNSQGFLQLDKTDFYYLIERTEEEFKPENSSQNDSDEDEQEITPEDKVDLEEITVKGEKGTFILPEYISLNSAISKIHIMYSDFELPYSLLKEIEKSPDSRASWMREINLQAPSGAATDLQQLTDVVADFSLKDLTMENQVSNSYRYTPIGRLKNWQDVSERLTYGKGVIVALEDPIGTIRDLARYQGYLDEQRGKILTKYEYAIRTASFIHSHAQDKILYNFKQQKERHDTVKDVIDDKNPWYTGFTKEWEQLYKKPMKAPVPQVISLEQSYKHYTKVAPVHLAKNSHNDIFSLLKQELNLEDIPGENAIHKMANLPGLYGKHFKSVVEAHIKLIDANHARFKILASLLDKEDTSAVYAANAFYLYAQGLLWGLDISSYGFNASSAALGNEMEVTYEPAGFQVGNESIQMLQNLVKLLNKSLEMVTILAKSSNFAISYYDLVVEVLISKHSALANPNNVKKVGQSTHFVKWKRVYEVNPVTGRYSYTDKFVASPNSMKEKILNTVKNSHSVPSEYAHFHVGSGLVKLQMLEVIIGFFNTQKYRTAEGQLANDPFLAAALALGGAKSTPILDKFKAKVDKSKSTVKADLVNSGGKPHRQNLKLMNFKIQSLSQMSTIRQIASRLISVNSALVFLNSLVEYGNWYESRYKNDALGQYGAMLRGFGGLTAGVSYGVLGLLAENALAVTGVAAAVPVALWVGLAAVVLGSIMGLLSKDDMDSWMENSFWGGSPNYWGNPIRGYEWDRKRIDDFLDLVKKSQFQYIENNNGLSLSEASQEVFKNYEIELQRYFAFKENIKLSKYESPNAVLVEHSSINNNAMAQSIRVDSQITVMTEYAHYSSTQQPERIVFIENGKAVIYFPSPWKGISWAITGTRKEKAKMETIDPSSVKNIRLKVYLADYQGSGNKISSDLTTIPMK